MFDRSCSAFLSSSIVVVLALFVSGVGLAAAQGSGAAVSSVSVDLSYGAKTQGKLRVTARVDGEWLAVGFVPEGVTLPSFGKGRSARASGSSSKPAPQRPQIECCRARRSLIRSFRTSSAISTRGRRTRAGSVMVRPPTRLGTKS